MGECSGDHYRWLPVPRLPSELRGEIATVSRNIVHPVYGGNRLHPQDETLIARGGGGWAAYDIYADLARDPHTYAVLQKRYMAVVGREWEVKAASSSKEDQKAADLVKQCLGDLGAVSDLEEDGETVISTGSGFDNLCWGLMSALLYGYQPAELIWDQIDNQIIPIEARIKDLRRFIFVPGEMGYKLRLLTWDNAYSGEPLPAKKFICHRFASLPTEDPYGLGLGTRLFYPVYFKRNAVKFWLVFADKWATPTALGKFPRNASTEQKNSLLAALQSIATDSGIAIPEEMAIEFLEASRSSSVSTYEGLVDFSNREISKSVLGETGTTDQQGSGGSRARDQVGNEVRIEVAKADSDLLSETINRTLVRWITKLNYPNARPPKVWRRFPELEERFDRSGEATIISTLSNAGYKATQKWVSERFDIDLEPVQPEADPNAPPDLSSLFGTGKQGAPEQATDQAPDQTQATPPEAEQGVDTTEQPPTLNESDDRTIEFRGSRDGLKKKTQRNCVKGYSCGNTCISRKKRCPSDLEKKAAAYADYLQQQIQQLQAQLETTRTQLKGTQKQLQTTQTQLKGTQTQLQATQNDLATTKTQLAAAQSPKQPKPGSVAEVDPKDVLADPKRFQYKILGEHTTTGEVGSLSGVKKFDPNLAGVIQAWVDPADGKTYVVNGHNRLALAKRLGAEKVTVRYLDVKDAQEARAVGALTNIAEGRGNAIDAAKFFKDSGLTKADLDAKGIPMREKIATDGIALSKLDDVLFRKVIDGDLPVERAVIVGGSGLDHQQQQSLMKLVDSQKRKVTNEVLTELVDTVKASQQQTTTQMSLFGASQVVIDNALERASLQAAIKKKLSREKKLFGTVSKSSAAQQLAQAGNVIDVNSSQKVSKDAATTLAVFDQLKNQTGAISRAINDAATQIQQGGDRKKIEAALYKDILAIVQSGNFSEEEE